MTTIDPAQYDNLTKAFRDAQTDIAARQQKVAESQAAADAANATLTADKQSLATAESVSVKSLKDLQDYLGTLAAVTPDVGAAGQ